MSLDRERGMWTCPSCRRRVPVRVLECRCGAFKAQAVKFTAGESGSRSSGSGGLKLTLGLGAVVVVCVAWVRYVWPGMEGNRKAPVTVQPAAPAIPPARAVPVAAAPPRQSEVAPAWSPAPTPWPLARVQTLGGGTAAPSTPTALQEGGGAGVPSLSEPDQARQRGLRQLEVEFRALAGNASQLIAVVGRYERSCNNVQSAACEAQLTQIGHLAIAVGAAIERTEDIARTSWLDPGVVRDLRVKYGLEDGVWDDIERLTREYRR
jgi:hypothetical protein